MLKAAVAGLGAISHVHLDTIARTPNAELVAVCDCKPEKKDVVQDVPFYTDLETMLDVEKPDVLHICLPHHLHIPAAKMAAARGIHVFMEKPPALDCEELKQLYGLEMQTGIKLGICLQNRYNNTTMELKRRLDSGEAGAVQGCKAVLTWNRPLSYYENDPWRGKWNEAGGGVMLSQAIHTLDLMTVFCGNPVTVSGKVGNLSLPQIGVEDSAMAQIEFENQVRGLFYGSVGYTRDAAIELEIACERAVYRIEDGKLWQLREQEQILLAKDTPVHSGKSYYGSGHLQAVQHFYRAVEAGSRDYITVQDARACMELIDGVNRSSREGCAVRTAL